MFLSSPPSLLLSENQREKYPPMRLTKRKTGRGRDAVRTRIGESSEVSSGHRTPAPGSRRSLGAACR